MRESTIKNYKDSDQVYNSTHLEAWVMGWGVTRWSYHNLLQWFQPPKLLSVVIVPQDRSKVDPEDGFEQEMFKPNGMFFNEPFCHYLKLEHGKETVFVNAGVLLHYFRKGRKFGYYALKELITSAKTNVSEARIAQSCTGDIQKESPSVK